MSKSKSRKLTESSENSEVGENLRESSSFNWGRDIAEATPAATTESVSSTLESVLVHWEQ